MEFEPVVLSNTNTHVKLKLPHDRGEFIFLYLIEHYDLGNGFGALVARIAGQNWPPFDPDKPKYITGTFPTLEHMNLEMLQKRLMESTLDEIEGVTIGGGLIMTSYVRFFNGKPQIGDQLLS